MSLYPLHRFTGSIFITCSFLLEQPLLIFSKPLTIDLTINIIFDEGDFNEIDFSCPWTITTRSNSEDFIITKLRWSPILHCFVAVKLHPTNDRNKITNFKLEEYSFLEAQLSGFLDNYAHNPEPHPSQYHLHVLGELADTTVALIKLNELQYTIRNCETNLATKCILTSTA